MPSWNLDGKVVMPCGFGGNCASASTAQSTKISDNNLNIFMIMVCCTPGKEVNVSCCLDDRRVSE